MRHSPCRPRALPAVLLAALSLASCVDTDAAATRAHAEDDAPVRRYQFDPSLPSDVVNGLSVVEVVARGDGCPDGNWFTQITPDGKTFRVRLIGYEAQIDETQASASKSCALAIKLRSRTPVSFALKSIAYLGYAFVDQGVLARFSTRPYFPDAPHQSRGEALELLGPYEDSFTQQSESRELLWSACGVERDVAVDTTLSVQNTTPPGAGFITIDEAHAALPGAVDTARFGITFTVRTCGDSVDAGPIVPPAEPDAGGSEADVSSNRPLGGLDASVPSMEQESSDTK